VTEELAQQLSNRCEHRLGAFGAFGFCLGGLTPTFLTEQTCY